MKVRLRGRQGLDTEDPQYWTKEWGLSEGGQVQRGELESQMVSHLNPVLGGLILCSVSVYVVNGGAMPASLQGDSKRQRVVQSKAQLL